MKRRSFKSSLRAALHAKQPAPYAFTLPQNMLEVAVESETSAFLDALRDTINNTIKSDREALKYCQDNLLPLLNGSAYGAEKLTNDFKAFCEVYERVYVEIYAHVMQLYQEHPDALEDDRKQVKQFGWGKCALNMRYKFGKLAQAASKRLEDR